MRYQSREGRGDRLRIMNQEGYSSRRAKMRTSPRVVAAGVMSWRRQGTLHRGHAWPTESKWPWTHPWQNVWPHGSVQASSKSSWQSGHDSVFWRPAMSWGVGGGPRGRGGGGGGGGSIWPWRGRGHDRGGQGRAVVPRVVPRGYYGQLRVL